MKVTIISDVHNNEVNLKKVLNYCKENETEIIICCGDLASMETLDFLNENFTGEIFFTFGNMDEGQMRSGLDWTSNFQVYKNIKIFRKFGEAEIDEKKVAFVHFPEVAKELCQTGKYNFVFYGHTHKPWEEKVNNCTLLNPGNVAGDIFPPTFAVWDTEKDKFELIRIHNLK